MDSSARGCVFSVHRLGVGHKGLRPAYSAPRASGSVNVKTVPPAGSFSADTDPPGAVITGFTSPAPDSYRLEYTLDGKLGAVEYTVQAGSVTFTFTAPDNTTTTETYTR